MKKILHVLQCVEEGFGTADDIAAELKGERMSLDIRATVIVSLLEFGADPTMIDVLGVKRQQIYGIRDPRASLVEQYQRDEDHVKRLAESYLRQRGLSTDLTHAPTRTAATDLQKREEA
jgi:hypothetical protein